MLTLYPLVCLTACPTDTTSTAGTIASVTFHFCPCTTTADFIISKNATTACGTACQANSYPYYTNGVSFTCKCYPGFKKTYSTDDFVCTAAPCSPNFYTDETDECIACPTNAISATVNSLSTNTKCVCDKANSHY